MKVIIAGSRSINTMEIVEQAIQTSGFTLAEIVSGGAKGVDALAERYAEKHALPIKIYPIGCDQYGRVAGLIRNAQMVDYADALIAVWDGQSAGTAHMIQSARDKNLPIYVHCAS